MAVNIEAVDQEARNMASTAANAISTHELVCAERWRNTMDTMRDIKRILAWGTIGLISAMGSLIAWLATHPPH
jgi:hypothetical protein